MFESPNNSPQTLSSIYLSTSLRLMQRIHELEQEHQRNATLFETLPDSDVKKWEAQADSSWNEVKYLQNIVPAITLFQARMESFINLMLTEPIFASIDTGNSFAKKWREALTRVGKPTTEFEFYCENIYKEYRNKFIHPKNDNFPDLSNLTYSYLYEGFKNGVLAWEHIIRGLSASTGQPEMDEHEIPQWEAVCWTYNVPEPS